MRWRSRRTAARPTSPTQTGKAVSIIDVGQSRGLILILGFSVLVNSFGDSIAFDRHHRGESQLRYSPAGNNGMSCLPGNSKLLRFPE
jgi:hypothetical protein